jgi:ribonuclease BN (tRNA processing enzyme)
MMDRDFFTLATEHFTIEGRSRAGQETFFRIRDLGLVLDIGRGPDLAVGMSNVFVSHAHLDHALGVPFYAGQRNLQRISGGRVFVPSETAADFRALMALHEKLEDVTYHVEIVGIAANDVMPIDRMHEVRAHQATHRVAARAYEFLEIRHRLREEYAGRENISDLRRRGLEVTEQYRWPLLFYTGDTDRGILESNEALFRAEVLIIECSFVAAGHQQRAVEYRHIHFDDIAEFAGRFENRMIVLTHFSRRYSRAQIRDEIRRRCPAVLRDRIRLALPEEFQRIDA